MNLLQIVCKTVITTIDFILVLGLLKTDSSKNVVKPFLVFILFNLAGVWI